MTSMILSMFMFLAPFFAAVMVIYLVIMVTTILAISQSVSTVGMSIFINFSLPKYLKTLIKILGNSSEKTKVLQNAYFKHIKKVNRTNMLYTLGLLILLLPDIYLLTDKVGRSFGLLLLPFVMGLSIYDMAVKIKNKVGIFGKKEREYFINFFYDIYTQDENLAKRLLDSFLLNHILAKTTASTKVNRYSIYSYENLPSSIDERNDFAYYSLINNYSNGIKILQAVKNQ